MISGKRCAGGFSTLTTSQERREASKVVGVPSTLKRSKGFSKGVSYSTRDRSLGTACPSRIWCPVNGILTFGIKPTGSGSVSSSSVREPGVSSGHSSVFVLTMQGESWRCVEVPNRSTNTATTMSGISQKKSMPDHTAKALSVQTVLASS